MKERIVLVLILATVVAVGCSREEAAPPGEAASAQEFEWTVKGKIVSLDAAGQRIRIDHQDIPGLMGAMVMDFRVEDASVLEGFAAGETVEFKLKQTSRGLTVSHLRKIDPAELEAGQEMKTYSGQGRVKVVNRALASVILENEAIPGVMPAGELALEVHPATLLEGIEDGTLVEFTLTETPNGLVVTDLKKR